MKTAGVLTIATGIFLVAGHGGAAAVLSLIRHAIRVIA